MAHSRSDQEARFRAIFRAAHAGHAACVDDEWLHVPCRSASGEPLDRPLVWSRRNGAWHQVDIAWVGAAPGNAGGKGRGLLGAHGTRIPFGGDIAGANLEALFGSIGLDRNHTFIVAALNQLPAAGGGEPTAAELSAPVGRYPTSLHLLRDTLVAAGPRLLVLLGTVAVRATMGAATAVDESMPRLPGPARLAAAGFERNVALHWPAALAPDPEFQRAWNHAWPDMPLPILLWLTHPSGQNMSPFAGTQTAFHRRMLEARSSLATAAAEVLGIEPPAQRPRPSGDGIYALPEWRQLIAPRLELLDELWRSKGV